MRVPHYRQHQIERRQVFVRHPGGYRGLGQSRLFVWRSFLATAAALSGSDPRIAISLLFCDYERGTYLPVFPVLSIFIASPDYEFVIEDFYFG
jgi:hypothetical protein